MKKVPTLYVCTSKFIQETIMAKLSELEEILNSRIIDAYLAGLSVLEITFVIDRNSAEYVHNLLRSRGYIDPFPSNTRRLYEADRALISALKSKGYSFAKWSMGWGLVASDAELELTERKDGKVKRAINRDFPKIFEKLYAEKMQPTLLGQGKNKIEKHSVQITWVDEQKEYVCSFLDDPNVSAAGCDIIEAAIRFEDVYRATNRIKWLDSAIGLFT
jgi:hypothetical protein